MLSKKHFIKFADIISKSDTKDDIVYFLCDYFKQENINFNKQRFLDACNK